MHVLISPAAHQEYSRSAQRWLPKYTVVLIRTGNAVSPASCSRRLLVRDKRHRRSDTALQNSERTNMRVTTTWGMHNVTGVGNGGDPAKFP